MKDYIVFFTKGFDEHTIERQKKVFPNAYISCIDSKPDYNRLLTESKLAKVNGFDNFYILWEREDAVSMSYEMKKEFKRQFKETAAIPYKYVMSLVEADTQVPPQTNVTPTTQSVTEKPVTTQQQTTPNTPQAQDVGIDGIESPFSSNVDPNIGSSSAAAVRYTKNHTATIYIWPFNLFSANLSSTGTGLVNLQAEMQLDNLSRMPNASVTSNATNTKKGDWQRILYIPQGQKELNQTLARADDMWNFTNKALLNTPFLIGGNASSISKSFQNFATHGLRVGGTKTAFGPLTERGIIDACLNNGASLAKKGNIHVFYPAEYGKYLNWLPAENKSVINSIKDIPNVKYNATCIKSLEQMENFINSCASGNGAYSVDDFKEILTSVSTEKYAKDAKLRLSELISSLNLNYYDIFWEYFNLYKLHKDVLGVPTGKGTGSDATNTEGIWSTLLGAIDNFLDNRHKHDLDWLKQMMGTLPKGEVSKGLKDTFDTAKDKIEQAAAIGNSAVNIVNSLKSKVAKHNAKNASNENNLQNEEDQIKVDSELGEEGIATSLEGLSPEEIEKLKQKNNINDKEEKEEDEKDEDKEAKEEKDDEKESDEEKAKEKSDNKENEEEQNDATKAGPNEPSNNPGAVLNNKTLFKIFAVFSPEWTSYVIPFFFTERVYNSFDKHITEKRVEEIRKAINLNRANKGMDVSAAAEEPVATPAQPAAATAPAPKPQPAVETGAPAANLEKSDTIPSTTRT